MGLTDLHNWVHYHYVAMQSDFIIPQDGGQPTMQHDVAWPKFYSMNHFIFPLNMLYFAEQFLKVRDVPKNIITLQRGPGPWMHKIGVKPRIILVKF